MSGPIDPSAERQADHPESEQRRMYRELRERTERQQRMRQLVIERRVQQQRDRRLRAFRRPSR